MIYARDAQRAKFYRRPRGQAPGGYYTLYTQTMRALRARLRRKWKKNTATTRDVSALRRIESDPDMVAMVRHTRGIDPMTGDRFDFRELVIMPGRTPLREIKRKPTLAAPNPPTNQELADRPLLYQGGYEVPGANEASSRMHAWRWIKADWQIRLKELEAGNSRLAQKNAIEGIKEYNGALDRTNGADKEYVRRLLKQLESIKSSMYRAPNRDKLEGLLEEGVRVANDKIQEATGRWKSLEAGSKITDELFGVGNLNRYNWERVQPWRDYVQVMLTQLLKTGETDEGYPPGVTPRARARWFLSPTYTPWEPTQLSVLEKLEQTRQLAPPGTQLALFNPPVPQEVRRVAAGALERRRTITRKRKGGTAVGVARARDLARGRVSSRSVARMRSFFARHDTPAERLARARDRYSPAAIAWDLWGGDAGRRWAKSFK